MRTELLPGDQKAILEAIHISKVFTSGSQVTPALAPLSLGISPGEFLVVTGPSGAGKSTLLNILCGLDTPSQGEVRFRQQKISELSGNKISELRNHNFGFIFQTPHLLTDKTVLENVALPFHYGTPLPRQAVYTCCMEILNYVGLADMANRYPSTLSGGEMQRIVFARALVRKPQIIFADEPTGSLDTTNSIHLAELLRAQTEQGRCVVMVSHDPLSEQFASRTLKMAKTDSGGQVV